MSADLTVPDTAMLTVWSLLRNTEGLDTHNAVAAAQMIAAPIVAAELRRLTVVPDRMPVSGNHYLRTDRLLARADELEAQS